MFIFQVLNRICSLYQTLWPLRSYAHGTMQSQVRDPRANLEYDEHQDGTTQLSCCTSAAQLLQTTLRMHQDDILLAHHRFCAQTIQLLSATFWSPLSSARHKTEGVKPYCLKPFIHYLGIVPSEVTRHLFDLSQIHEGVQLTNGHGNEVNTACLTVKVRQIWD